MGMMNGVGNLGNELRRAPQIRAQTLCRFGQITALHQFHAVEAEAVPFSDFVDRHDVGMVQMGRCAGLKAKTFPSVRACQMSWRDGLQSNQTSETPVTRSI